jgi:hypothetical protein
LVLDGVFQDEHGDCLAGTYVRNPPTSSHTPGSEPGCTIFVKLWQFDPDDRMPVRIDTSAVRFAPPLHPRGLEFALLSESARKFVLLERWAPGIILVLYPAFVAQTAGRCNTATLQATAGRGRCEVWVKSGPLAHAPYLTAAASPVFSYK